MLQLSTFEGPLILLVNWSIVDTIQVKDNKFVTGVKIKATVDLKLIDSPEGY